MAEKTASVRLDLKADGFRRGFTGAKQHVEQGAKSMGDTLKSELTKGSRAGMQAVDGMLSNIKSGFLSLGGLAGGIGFAELVRGAIDSQTQLRNLSSSIEFGTGKLVKWEQLQSKAQASAKRWGQDSEKLGQALNEMFQGTGNIEFAQDALETIATTARATGAPVEQLSKIAGTLQQKFGITAQELPQAMSAVVAGAAKGGASIENLADDFAEIGGKAKTMGLSGTDGVKQMLGWLNLAKEETGRFEQAMTALPQIWDQLFERANGGKLTSSGKVPIKIETVDQSGRPRNPNDIITDIIKKTGGDATKMGEFGFGGEGLQTVLRLAKEYQVELKKTGGDMDAAGRRVSAVLTQAAGNELEYSKIQQKAAENLKSPAANIEQAIETLKQAFTKPEMQEAISSLATNLPALAKAVADVVQFISKETGLAAGVLMGSSYLKGGMGSLGQYEFGKGGGGGASSVAVTGAESFGVTAGKEVGSRFTLAGTTVAENLKAAMLAGGAVALAVDQLSKLVQESRGLDKEIGDERENLMGLAERRGEGTTTRKRSLAERIFKPKDQWSLSELFEDEETLSRGSDGKVKAGKSKGASLATLFATGRMTSADDDEPVKVLMGKAHNDLGGGKYGPKYTGEGPRLDLGFGPSTDPGALEKSAQGGGQAAKAQAAEIGSATGRAVSEALSNRRVSTQVSNAEEIGAAVGRAINASGKLNGPPTPGNSPR